MTSLSFSLRAFLCSREFQLSTKWLISNVLCHHQKAVPLCSAQCLPLFFGCWFFLAAGKASCFHFSFLETCQEAELPIRAVVISLWILARDLSLSLRGGRWLNIIWILITVPSSTEARSKASTLVTTAVRKFFN